MKNRENTLKLILSSLFLALAFVMPFLTGQIPEIGSMLCPLHIPIIICGFICGWKWGLIIGFITPLLRSLTLGMPPFFPNAICMAFELATYGSIAGVLYNLLPKKKIFIYGSLLSSMIIGRIVWGITMLISINATGGKFTFNTFLSGAIINALPGIILEIILIPILIMILEKFNLFKNNKNSTNN